MNRYSDIASFEDFKFEKERLKLRKKLVETRIRFVFIYLRKTLSFSDLPASLLKDIIFTSKQ
jgi:hypothetical protein